MDNFHLPGPVGPASEDSAWLPRACRFRRPAPARDPGDKRRAEIPGRRGIQPGRHRGPHHAELL